MTSRKVTPTLRALERAAHISMVRLARRELAKRAILGGETTRYLELNYRLLMQVAKRHGYSLTVHGSMLRDIDLVAVPWVARCKAPSTLIKAFKSIVEVQSGREKVYVRINKKPEIKPHGRLAWSLWFSRSAYLDISVCARHSAALKKRRGRKS